MAYEINAVVKALLDGEDVHLENERLRILHWMILLRILDPNKTPEEWSVSLSDARTVFQELKTKFRALPEKKKNEQQDLELNNPLSLAKESPWASYYADNQLLATIQQDVERTYPEDPVFRDEKVQTALSDVLFLWAKLHPDMEYRQGMHELLGIIYLVLQNAMKAKASTKELPIMKQLLDPAYTESTAFTLFSAILDGIADLYAHAPLTPGTSLPLTDLLQHLYSRMEQTLPNLYHHFAVTNVAPEVFGIRWMRLLFGREFEMDKLLRVWDGVFALWWLNGDKKHQLLEATALAMLSAMETELLKSDPTNTLLLLMKPNASLNNIVFAEFWPAVAKQIQTIDAPIDPTPRKSSVHSTMEATPHSASSKMEELIPQSVKKELAEAPKRVWALANSTLKDLTRKTSSLNLSQTFNQMVSNHTPTTRKPMDKSRRTLQELNASIESLETFISHNQVQLHECIDTQLLTGAVKRLRELYETLSGENNGGQELAYKTGSQVSLVAHDNTAKQDKLGLSTATTEETQKSSKLDPLGVSVVE